MAVMYRTEMYSGSQERRFAYVLRFEVFTLGNSHILEELVQNELVRRPDLVEQMKDMIREFDENGYVDDMPENNQLEFTEKLREEVSAQTHKDIQYALWLDYRMCVKRFYHGINSEIEGYETSDVILSNLGSIGILFGYEFEPCPVK